MTTECRSALSGALAEYLDVVRTNPWYRGMRDKAGNLIKGVPMVGNPWSECL